MASLTNAQLTSVLTYIMKNQNGGILSSRKMSKELGIDVDTCTRIAGAAVGVRLFPELEEWGECVWAYIKDITPVNADGTLDKLIVYNLPDDKTNCTDVLVAKAFGYYVHDVQMIMGGVAGPNGEQLDSRTLKKVYRKTRDPKPDHSEVLNFCTVSLCIMLRDFGVQPDMIADIVQLYSENRPAREWMVRGILYKWQAPSLAFKQMRIPKAAIRAIIGAIVQCMPQPVQDIRQKLVHGSDETPSTVQVNTYHPEFLFTEEMNTLLRFAVFIVQPYTEQKISQEERALTGQVYERSLYRSTDMGQQGRRFSLDDRTDILDRTVLMSFCPLICRSVPVTDKGAGLVIIPNCTVESWTGEHEYTATEQFAKLTVRADRYRQYRKQGYYRKGGISIPYTEEQYEKDMEKIVFRRTQVTKRIRQLRENGFYIRYTCTATGQQFTVFTRSVARAEKLRAMTGIVAEAANELVYESTSGPFGEGDIVQADTHLISETVREYRPQGVFFRSLKYVTRTLFQFLFRRAVGVSTLITEDKEVRKHRRNQWAPFSLHECLEKIDEYSRIQLSTEEHDVLETELMLPEQLFRAGRGEARVRTYNELRFRRTGYESTLNRDQYRELKKKVYASILSKLEAADELYSGKAATEMTAGPGPLSECPVDNSLRIPHIAGTSGVVYSSTVDVRAWTKRSWEECRMLDKNPRIRNYKIEIPTTVQYPCWRDVKTGDVVQVIESTHDDVAVY